MRAQSHVVGVALMLGLAVVALGSLTAGIGMIVDTQVSNADADRVADDLETALEGVERTGVHSHPVRFTEGGLATSERTLRVLENGTVVERHGIGAVSFEGGDEHVTFVAGAVVRGTGENAWLTAEPPITSSRRNSVLVVGVPVVGGGHTTVAGQGGVRATLRTDVEHAASELGTGEYSVAIETAAPGAFERYFERLGAETERRTFGDDQFGSVVARFPGERDGYLVRHELNLEIQHG